MFFIEGIFGVDGMEGAERELVEVGTDPWNGTDG
jgi:hypothetical protein